MEGHAALQSAVEEHGARQAALEEYGARQATLEEHVARQAALEEHGARQATLEEHGARQATLEEHAARLAGRQLAFIAEELNELYRQGRARTRRPDGAQHVIHLLQETAAQRLAHISRR